MEENTDPTTLLKNATRSSALTLSAAPGNKHESSSSATRNHSDASGRATTRRLSGSHNLSISLRAAWPPRLRTSERAMSGPRCVMAVARVSAMAGEDSLEGLRERKFA
jgi:hypothetical protein